MLAITLYVTFLYVSNKDEFSPFQNSNLVLTESKYLLCLPMSNSIISRINKFLKVTVMSNEILSYLNVVQVEEINLHL